MRFVETTFARQMTSTDLTTYVELMLKAKCLIVRETEIGRGGVRTDIISLVDRDGNPFPATVGGFTYCPLSVPRRVFAGLAERGMIEPDRPPDAQGRTFFRLSATGLRRPAHAGDAA